MPLVPLFDSSATPVPALELQPSVPVIVGAALLGALVLVAVGLAAATGAGRRITLRRVRESL
jgi:putative ABC transport system permease protein